MELTKTPVNKRYTVWLAVIPALVLSAILLVHFFSVEHTKTFSQEFIQQKVNAKLPKLVAYNRFKVTSANVEIQDHAAKLLINVEGAKTGNIHAVVSAIGKPRYNKNTAEFFFEPEDVTVEQIDWKGKPPSEWKILGLSGENAADWLKTHAENIAVSTLEGMPVFRIKDEMKWSWVIRSSLKNVEIQNGQLVVTFSVLNLTIAVVLFFFAMIACIGLVIAMLANPELFLVFGLFSLFQ